MSRTSRSAMVIPWVCFVLFCVPFGNARNAAQAFELDRLNQTLGELLDNASQYDAGQNAQTQEQFSNEGIEVPDELQQYLTRLEKRAEPEPIALYPLNGEYGTKEINGRAPAGLPRGVKLAQGPDGKNNGSYEFAGNANSYIQFPNNGTLDTQYSMTMLCWVYPANNDGPLFNYNISRYHWGVHLWIVEGNLFATFPKRNYAVTEDLTSTRLAKGKWSYVGASYDRGSGDAKLWIDGKVARTRNIGSNLQLATQDDVRMGAKVRRQGYFKGRIAQMRVYNVALNQQQVQNARKEIIQVNECLQNPCKNEGSCKDLSDGYKYSCTAGYSGKNCENDINECTLTTPPCKNDAKCTNVIGSYRCSCAPGFQSKNCDIDINECSIQNGGCSHNCTNTIGSYLCSCPDTELSLGEDKHTCEAKGVIIACQQNDMSITIPKKILKGMDREHLRLLDPTCGATETETQYSLKTPLTGCGTTRRHTKSAVVYTNKVSDIPINITDIVTRVSDIEIPFSCYYSNRGLATAVGLKPESRKSVFTTNGKGNFTIALEFYHTKSFATPYSEVDYPLSVNLRQHIYIQSKVDTKDKRLSIMAEKCLATPTSNKNDLKKYIINGGCPIDDTVKFLPSPTGFYRFTMEAFEFVDQPFLFIHCHMLICDAEDAASTCARGCQKNKQRLRRSLAKDDEIARVYTLTQGPITLNFSANDQTYFSPKHQPKRIAINVPLVAAMAAVTALCAIILLFMAFRSRKLPTAEYVALETDNYK